MNTSSQSEPPVTINKCGHTFGSTCLSAWLEKATTCPTCRVELFAEEIPDWLKNGFISGSSFWILPRGDGGESAAFETLLRREHGFRATVTEADGGEGGDLSEEDQRRGIVRRVYA
ncbi:hypothetical protein BDV96DRAFT_645394 [Lophiotrema nucula]|uniref:RING-type domain-containing protein n=1 Tax=Lophiotrema nucula TaxID=690887 RepID=A0A6A5ZAX4_9PLEO|nr:hypothetical protein BDV96DRAFT_645394 [Lophiotrema nucula]